MCWFRFGSTIFYKEKKMTQSKLKDAAIEFSVRVIELCDSIDKHKSLLNQLERAATSIGANIHEANYAQSKADFVSKLQISLKEAYESEYWLDLIERTELFDSNTVRELKAQCGTLRRILIASINTAKGTPKKM